MRVGLFRSVIGGVFLASSVAWGGPSPLTERAALHGSWQIVPMEHKGRYGDELRDIAAISTTDAWALGDSITSGGNVPLVEHWDGTTWTAVKTSPDASALGGITALSSSEVWAVGDAIADGQYVPFAERFDGTTWSSVPAADPPRAFAGLSAVSATVPDDIWAVGGTEPPGTNVVRTLIEHYDGKAWSIVPSPNAGDESTYNDLTGVVALGTDDAWAVDSTSAARPLALHWDGGRWSKVSLPPLGKGAFLSAVDGSSSSDVWFVGGTRRGALIGTVLPGAWYTIQREPT